MSLNLRKNALSKPYQIVFTVFVSYVQEKKRLRAELETEEREGKNLRKALHEKGKLIIEMKISLQQINQLLSSVGKYVVLRGGKNMKDVYPPAFSMLKFIFIVCFFAFNTLMS